MNTNISNPNNNYIKKQMSTMYEEVPNQYSFVHGKVLKRVKSTLINNEKGNMPQEFGKLRPIKTTHSPTMTP